MEYYLCRAMEIARLTESQLQDLQEHEKKERILKDFDQLTGEYRKNQIRERRCSMPYEIQAMFSLVPLKEIWCIPFDDLSAQAAHSSRLRGELKKIIAPLSDLPVVNVKDIHDFDIKIRNMFNSGEVDFVYSGGKKERKRLTDGI